MPDIVLAACNARYRHTAFGLRYLLANLGPWQARATLLEFTLEHTASEAVERILAHQPVIVGLGVYIWNAAWITRVARLLKTLAPRLTVVLGGPEIGRENHPAAAWADFLIAGEGELAFRQLCQDRLTGQTMPQRLIPAPPPRLADLAMPYDLYTDEDLQHREIYVEASRGCPYTCTFCLSSLDRQVRRWPLEPLLAAFTRLLERGGRRFKFVDRSFNLDPRQGVMILEFFLARLPLGLFLHLEVAPEKLSPAVMACLQRFPPATLQLEIGVQSLAPAVRQRIRRPGSIDLVLEHIHWLVTTTHAHLHADLIVGLPGETLAGFAKGFNRLLATGVHEIQVGILKRLPGTPMGQEASPALFDPEAPYTLLANGDLSFDQVRRLERFARFWDMIGNAGRFQQVRTLVGDFDTFLALSDWLYARLGRTHQIALDRLTNLLQDGLVAIGLPVEQVNQALEQDRRRRQPDRRSTAIPERQQRHRLGVVP